MTPVEEIKAKLNIIDLVREYVPHLKAAGGNWKANCPFHNEKTPSFMVSPAKEIWHCFGCGAGGDIFEFVKKIENVEFPEALRLLAKKAGVILRPVDPAWQDYKTRLLDILQLTSEYYHRILLESSIAQAARDYLLKRQISQAMIEQFKLGWAPADWDQLEKFLVKKGFKDQEILAAGLILLGKTGNNYYDRFRERLLFPISDHHGTVVGFGGRTLKTGSQEAKYINSPQSQVYDKSRILYGLDKAKQEIRVKDRVIIVEGYTDVIASHQAGVINTVSVSGTALTPQQLLLLGRYTKNLVFCFDQDTAGRMASERGVGLALQQEFNVFTIVLPDGIKDPDELVKTNPQSWLKLSAQTQPFVAYYLEQVLKQHDLSSAEGKKQAAKILLTLIKKITNPLEQEHYLQRLAQSLMVEINILKRVIANQPSSQAALPAKALIAEPAVNHWEQISQQLLALVVRKPELLPVAIMTAPPEILNGEANQSLYKELIVYYTEKQNLDLMAWAKSLAISNPVLAKKFAVLQLLADDLTATEGQEQKLLQQLIAVLKKNTLQLQIKQLQEALRVAEAKNDRTAIARASLEIQQLLKELGNII